MKLLKSDDTIIVFLERKLIQKVDFTDLDEVDQFLRSLIKKMREDYKLIVYGYYNVKIHLDHNYGAILEFQKEELEYFEYYEQQVDLNVNINYENFVYEIYDYNYLEKNYNLYKFKNKLFLKLENISDIELGRILEYTEVIYGTLAEEIIEKGKEILV